MNLQLHQLIPIPLREKTNANQSAIWNTAITLAKGEHVFVMAPSGTGKTTLIHILSGIRKDYEGLVKWDDISLSSMDREQLAMLRTSKISIIFQDMRLFPELTTWENIEVKRQLTDTVSATAAENWLNRLGLSDKKHSIASTLSYGEQQRVAIIRALLQPFEWLLMDEPFSHLDHANIQKAIVLINEVVQQNNAGMLLADLDENNYFHYTRTISL